MQRQPAADLENTGCHLLGLQGIQKRMFLWSSLSRTPTVVNKPFTSSALIIHTEVHFHGCLQKNGLFATTSLLLSVVVSLDVLKYNSAM